MEIYGFHFISQSPLFNEMDMHSSLNREYTLVNRCNEVPVVQPGIEISCNTFTLTEVNYLTFDQTQAMQKVRRILLLV